MEFPNWVQVKKKYYKCLPISLEEGKECIGASSMIFKEAEK